MTTVSAGNAGGHDGYPVSAYSMEHYVFGDDPLLRAVAGPRAYVDEMIARTFRALDTPPAMIGPSLAADGPGLDWWSDRLGVPPG